FSPLSPSRSSLFPYTTLFRSEAVLVVGLWRFISERRPWDFYIACAGFALMFTIKETSYIIAAVFGIFLLGLFAWQAGRWMFITLDRKSTRLNSSHLGISYAVF